jgi:HAE1 family hydrophobic/amphiphilic exporter-1
LKAEGKHFKEALIIAGKGRMRPILMTTIAMIIGMLPIALAKEQRVNGKMDWHG